MPSFGKEDQGCHGDILYQERMPSFQKGDRVAMVKENIWKRIFFQVREFLDGSGIFVKDSKVTESSGNMKVMAVAVFRKNIFSVQG